ncbi:type II 3-dehydroquinate dehydratase [Microbacterium indicum]|uniref:type II 3-dehydroquinate dehydratase n=1 Tax=Microbacterium indicum TaxID=358100 RepID=UPI000422FA95|nr:type II 3-dehydroquinate dehydratase [Microbacterium indicum]
MANRILLVNGPNLNLLGTREPEVYGSDTLDDIVALTVETARVEELQVVAMQSNHEGEIVDAIHSAREDCAGIIINAGAYTHTSVAIRDALKAVALPFIEVHISNVHAREEFRHRSYLSDIAECVIVGAGIQGYEFAVERLARVIA